MGLTGEEQYSLYQARRQSLQLPGGILPQEAVAGAMHCASDGNRRQWNRESRRADDARISKFARQLLFTMAGLDAEVPRRAGVPRHVPGHQTLQAPAAD